MGRVRVYVRMCPDTYRALKRLLAEVERRTGRKPRMHTVIEAILENLPEPEPDSLPDRLQECRSTDMIETNMRIRIDLLEKIGRSRNYAVVYAIRAAAENIDEAADLVAATVTHRSSRVHMPASLRPRPA